VKQLRQPPSIVRPDMGQSIAIAELSANQFDSLAVLIVFFGR
jgi:hypothetical protein